MSKCMTRSDGSHFWYSGESLGESLHREDGPAIEYYNGDRIWCQKGWRHREDGPACVYADGTEEWWLNGVQCTQEQIDILILAKFGRGE